MTQLQLITRDHKQWPVELHIEMQKWAEQFFNKLHGTVEMMRYHSKIDKKEIEYLKKKIKDLKN